MQRLTVVFRKAEGARFLSHLDLLAAFEYAVRRAQLPIALSEGFNPRPRLSVASSLALGHVGETEILEITLREPVHPDEAALRLGAALPPGITIVSAGEVPPGTRTAASRLRSAIYRVQLPAAVPDLGRRVADLTGRARLDVEEPRDGRVRRRDVRPLILSLDAPSPDALRLELRLDGEGSVRPETILDLLRVPRDGARITRERIVLDAP
jgi:radical SAM-linked protein